MKSRFSVFLCAFFLVTFAFSAEENTIRSDSARTEEKTPVEKTANEKKSEVKKSEAKDVEKNPGKNSPEKSTPDSLKVEKPKDATEKAKNESAKELSSEKNPSGNLPRASADSSSIDSSQTNISASDSLSAAAFNSQPTVDLTLGKDTLSHSIGASAEKKNLLTWERLFESIDSEPMIHAGQKKQTMLQGGTNTKLWNSLEFQYKLNGFGFMEHDFELKFKPKDFGEGNSTEEYWKAQSAYQQSKTNFERSYFVYERCERGLRYLTRQKIHKLHRDMGDVNRDRLEVLHLKSGSETFSPEALVNALEREADLLAEALQDSNSLLDIELKFKSWLDFDSVALDTAFFPSIEKIESELKQSAEVDDSYPSVAIAKSKWNVAEKRYRQETVGSGRILSSIGVGYKHSFGSWEYDSVKTGTYSYDYDNLVSVADKEWRIIKKPDDRRVRDKFYAEVTLRLPFFGTDGGDETKRQLDVLEAESDYLDEKRNISQKVARIREETLALIAQRDVQKEFVERVNAGKLFEEFAEQSGSDPLLLLRARDVSLESELRIAKLEYEIYSRYLILLDYAGVLEARGKTSEGFR